MQLRYLGEALEVNPSISILQHLDLAVVWLQEIKDMTILKHLVRGNADLGPGGFGSVQDLLHGHGEQARMILGPLH